MKFTKAQKRAMKRLAASSPNLVRQMKSGKGGLTPQQLRVQQGAVSRNHYL